MKFGQVESFILDMWANAHGDGSKMVSVLLLGPPGIGKTSMCRAIARKMTEVRRSSDPTAPEAVCEVVDTSSKLPEDLGGLPFRDGAVTRYAPQEWMAGLCKPGVYGVVCLDDIAVSQLAVQVASRQLVLERSINGSKLSDGIVVIATANRRDDKSAASTLPAHFRNSVLQLTVEPAFGGDRPGEGWRAWYASQQGRDPDVLSYLIFRPEMFSKLPSDGDKDPVNAFPTPRTWDKLGQISMVAGDYLHEVAAGLVGVGAAADFVAYKAVRKELVDPEALLRDPLGTLPDPRTALASPDKMTAMTVALAEAAARHKGKDQVSLFLRALGHITPGKEEFIGVGFTHFANVAKVKPDAFRLAAEKAKTDPLVARVITFCIACFGK